MSKIKIHLIGTTLSILFASIFLLYPIFNAKYAIDAQGADGNYAYSIKTKNQKEYYAEIKTIAGEMFLFTTKENKSDMVDMQHLGLKMTDYEQTPLPEYWINLSLKPEPKIYFLSKLNPEKQFDVILSNSSPIELIASPNAQHLFVKSDIDDSGATDIKGPKSVLFYSNDKGETWRKIENNWYPSRDFIGTNPLFVNEQEAWLMGETPSIIDHKDINEVFDSIYYSNDSAFHFSAIEPINKKAFIAELDRDLKQHLAVRTLKNAQFEHWPNFRNKKLALYPLSNTTIIVWKKLILNRNTRKSMIIQFTLNKKDEGWIAQDISLLDDVIENIKGYQDNIYAMFYDQSTKKRYLQKLDINDYKWHKTPPTPSIFGILSLDYEPAIIDFEVTKNSCLIGTSQSRRFHTIFSILGLIDKSSISGDRIFYLSNKNNDWKPIKTNKWNLLGTDKQKDIYYHNNESIYKTGNDVNLDYFEINK